MKSRIKNAVCSVTKKSQKSAPKAYGSRKIFASAISLASLMLIFPPAIFANPLVVVHQASPVTPSAHNTHQSNLAGGTSSTLSSLLVPKGSTKTIDIGTSSLLDLRSLVVNGVLKIMTKDPTITLDAANINLGKSGEILVLSPTGILTNLNLTTSALTNLGTIATTGTITTNIHDSGSVRSNLGSLISGNGQTLLNVTANGGSVFANTNNLVLNQLCISGDPTFYNSGVLTIGATANYNAALTLIAGGNIDLAGFSLSTKTTGASGQNIVLIAGANVSQTGLNNPLSAGQKATVTGATINGGNILASGATLNSSGDILANNVNGGSITLVAFRGTNNTSGGSINLGNSTLISSSGLTGQAGSITAIAPQGITLGTITMSSTAGAANLNLTNATPKANITADATGAITGTISAGTLSPAGTGNITLSSTVTGGSTNINLTAGNLISLAPSKDISLGGSIAMTGAVGAAGANGAAGKAGVTGSVGAVGGTITVKAADDINSNNSSVAFTLTGNTGGAGGAGGDNLTGKAGAGGIGGVGGSGGTVTLTGANVSVDGAWAFNAGAGGIGGAGGHGTGGAGGIGGAGGAGGAGGTLTITATNNGIINTTGPAMNGGTGGQGGAGGTGTVNGNGGVGGAGGIAGTLQLTGSSIALNGSADVNLKGGTGGAGGSGNNGGAGGVGGSGGTVNYTATQIIDTSRNLFTNGGDGGAGSAPTLTTGSGGNGGNAGSDGPEIALRSGTAFQLANGISAFMADFSLPSAVATLKPLSELRHSSTAADRLLFSKVMKNAVILQYLSARAGKAPYKANTVHNTNKGYLAAL